VSELRRPRFTARRRRDADLLEAALGTLPTPAEKLGLVILTGLPGSGKSHLAREIARSWPAAVLDSDALRCVLFPRPRHTKREHARLFPAIHVLIDTLLARGIPAIVDATNLKRSSRQPYHGVAARYGVRPVTVRVWAPRKVVAERLRRRESSSDPLDRSSAGLDVYEAMLADVEPVRERHVSVNTRDDIRPAVDRIVRLLRS
jgi:predicted kinase